jgi:hypothetical protein
MDELNGYRSLAEAYRKLGEDRKAEILDFIAGCTEEDLYTIVDSTALNEVIKAYSHAAAVNAGFDIEQRGELATALRYALDEQTAADVMMSFL